MYELILDGIKWSFSSVNCYENCPKCFFLSYIEALPKLNNAFAQWGSFGHSLLEGYYQGKYELFDLAQEYEDGYTQNVTIPFPNNKYVDLNQKYYEAGLQYFCSFQGLDSKYEVIAVEQKINSYIGNRKFVGFIDLILRDKDDGRYVIVDHKSKSGFKNRDEESDYLRQLYLYSSYIKDKYGEFPKELIFNMFRAQDTVVEKFNERDYDKAIQWFLSTIEKIYHDKKFVDKIAFEYKNKKKKLSEYKRNDYFCNELCGVRTHCKRSFHGKG